MCKIQMTLTLKSLRLWVGQKDPIRAFSTFSYFLFFNKKEKRRLSTKLGEGERQKFSSILDLSTP